METLAIPGGQPLLVAFARRRQFIGEAGGAGSPTGGITTAGRGGVRGMRGLGGSSSTRGSSGCSGGSGTDGLAGSGQGWVEISPSPPPTGRRQAGRSSGVWATGRARRPRATTTD
ncbi:hypothetical protein ACFQOZ_06555 [Comamonas endophytica]|uniref:hypothetical protein n=1 Tax=Comamonas endophytica TaxID=2949090 RepID=UPI00361CF936